MRERKQEREKKVKEIPKKKEKGEKVRGERNPLSL
jgi:hypothetical protein